jgi:hypothetical protein
MRARVSQRASTRLALLRFEFGYGGKFEPVLGHGHHPFAIFSNGHAVSDFQTGPCFCSVLFRSFLRRLHAAANLSTARNMTIREIVPAESGKALFSAGQLAPQPIPACNVHALHLLGPQRRLVLEHQIDFHAENSPARG